MSGIKLMAMSCESTYIQNQNKKINFPFHTVEYSLHKELKVTSEHLSFAYLDDYKEKKAKKRV